jgi:hypothetical protein
MSTRMQSKAKTASAPTPSFAPLRSGLLERKGTFGSTPGLTGEFVGSRGKSLVSQPPLIQAKLTINQPNDRYEREADRVADLVMRMPEPGCHECDEEEGPVQSKPLATEKNPLVQRQVEEEEEEEVQTKRTDGQTPHLSPSVEARIRFLKGGGQPLPRSVRNFFEPRFSHDFSRVRIHTDARAAYVARTTHAKAFTLGTDIVFGSGQYLPQTPGGRRLLAHELTHVVQQNNRFPKGMPALLNRQVERTNDEEHGELQTGEPRPWSVGATTPDGVDLGPTSTTNTFCKRGTFLGIYRVGQNSATDATGNAVITFRGMSSGRQNGRDCRCNCGIFRQFIKHYWRVGSPTATERHDFSSCGHNLTASETSWTEEYTSCIGDNDPSPCRFHYSDFPGLHGLSNGMYAEAWYRFKYQIWDRCEGRPVSTAFNTLTIRGRNAPRTIRWSYVG